MESGPIANVEQAEAWDGEQGVHWARHEQRFDVSVRGHHRRLVDSAAVVEHEVVLDVGCGNGQLACAAARTAHAGEVVGVDLSGPMLERARIRAEREGLANVRFERADAQVHPFENHRFDLAVSRFGVMFFSDAAAAFSNIGRTLRRGGRLAMAVWRSPAENEWLRAIAGALAVGRDLPAAEPGAPGPFALADAAYTRGLLTHAGFTELSLEPVDEPFLLGSDAADAAGFTAGLGAARMLLAGLDDDDRRRALDSLEATMAAHETPDGVVFGSASWVITAHRP